MKQAERTTPQHVELHIKRQRALGEKMIGDTDKPRLRELLVTLIALAALAAWAYHNHYYPFN